MKRFAALVLLALALAGPVQAQGLRSKIEQLFVFGTGQKPLFLAGTADPSNPTSLQAHGAHFIPAAVDGNATLISFLTSAIGSNIANLPISATSSGRTFRFEGGVPIATSTSPGPIFAERAQTLGRGRVLVGANVNVFHLKAVRGVDLNDVMLNFTHENVDFGGCDTIFGGDCSLMGIPGLENEWVQLDLSLDLDVRSTVFFLTYGLMDQVDIGVAIPIVTTSLRGSSTALVIPFGGPTATHFFAGTPGNPELSASRSIDGSATGLGDIATRLKVRVAESEKTAFAILADGRFATGSEEDLLGAGHTSIRGLGIISSQFGNFSPHANVGYLYRTDDILTDAFLATIGFDHVLSDWATIAVDLITEFQVGDTKLLLPDDVQIEIPFRRTVSPSNIPNMRDDIINGSLGFKFVTGPGITIVANTLWPLNNGGLRPDVGWTVGLEYNF